jgi:hypothetical protein
MHALHLPLEGSQPADQMQTRSPSWGNDEIFGLRRDLVHQTALPDRKNRDIAAAGSDEPTGDARVHVTCEGVGLMRDGVVQCHAAFEMVSAGHEFSGADQRDAEHYNWVDAILRY